jgi:hypothetical protein
MTKRDRTPLPRTFEALARKFSELTSEAWQASPERTVLAVTLALEALAVQFVRRHPDHRINVLARLTQLLANVNDATDAVPDDVRH